MCMEFSTQMNVIFHPVLGIFHSNKWNFPPTADVIIKQPLQNQKHVERETAKMQCKVQNPKNIPVTWLKDGVELEPSDRYVLY